MGEPRRCGYENRTVDVCRRIPDDGQDRCAEHIGRADPVVSDIHVIALANVSGALVDSGVIVPEDATRYGEAVRKIVRERDEALRTSEGRREQLSRLACEKTIEWKRAENAEAEALTSKQDAIALGRERDEARAASDEMTEAYLQRALRDLHGVVKRAIAGLSPAQPANGPILSTNESLMAGVSDGAQSATPKEHCPRRLMGETLAPHAPCDTGDRSKDAQPTPIKGIEFCKHEIIATRCAWCAAPPSPAAPCDWCGMVGEHDKRACGLPREEAVISSNRDPLPLRLIRDYIDDVAGTAHGIRNHDKPFHLCPMAICADAVEFIRLINAALDAVQS